MTSLNPQLQIRSAARQIRSMMNADVLTQGELDRLLRQIERGIEDDFPIHLAPALEAVPTGPFGRFEVIRGDRL